MSAADQITREVLQAAKGGAPVAVATVLRTSENGPAVGAKLLVRKDGERVGSLDDAALDDAVAEDSLEAITRHPRIQVETIHYSAEGKRIERDGDIDVMIEVTESPVSLLIVGGGHIGQSLAAVGAEAGFSVAVLDDREAFANDERFPSADRVICGDITEELERYAIDGSTFIVLVSRGHKQDEAGLRSVVGSDAAYIGMIGSKRRVSTVLTHMAREGIARDALERVHTPVGLDIGAETPEEIAVSIVAEIIAVRRGGTGQRMSDVRKARIEE
jgi:xanthine dehydrogenase accessory factor